MSFLGSQLWRFWYWVQQGGNSNIILVGVTLWYVVVTRRIMKATARQAAAMLEPALTICGLLKRDEPAAKCFLVENVGAQPIVILDIQEDCYLQGHKFLTKANWLWMDVVISANAHKEFSYGFDKELAARHIQEFDCAYQISVVVSDLSRQVVACYRYHPGTGDVTCTLGMPVTVRLRHFQWRWKWRYNRLRGWLKKSRN